MSRTRLPNPYDLSQTVIRELEALTGRKIGFPALNEKFMGLLPDDPPKAPPKTSEELGLKLIRDFNEREGKMILRRWFTKIGFAILLPSDAWLPRVMPILRKYDLEQSGGPSRGLDNERLVWVRSVHTKLESVTPTLEVIYGNVTQSGKYVFESVDDLRDYLVDRAGREGVTGSRYDLETEIDQFFSVMPPRRDTFRNISPGSDEQFVVEGLAR